MTFLNPVSASKNVPKLFDDSVDDLALMAKLVVGQRPDAKRDKKKDYEQRIHG